jgi:hypothetical protein
VDGYGVLSCVIGGMTERIRMAGQRKLGRKRFPRS